MQYNGVAYVEADQDTIMNREADTEKKIAIGSTVTDRKETQYQLVMKNEADVPKIKMLTAKSILLAISPCPCPPIPSHNITTLE